MRRSYKPLERVRVVSREERPDKDSRWGASLTIRVEVTHMDEPEARVGAYTFTRYYSHHVRIPYKPRGTYGELYTFTVRETESARVLWCETASCNAFGLRAALYFAGVTTLDMTRMVAAIRRHATRMVHLSECYGWSVVGLMTNAEVEAVIGETPDFYEALDAMEKHVARVRQAGGVLHR